MSESNDARSTGEVKQEQILEDLNNGASKDNSEESIWTFAQSIGERYSESDVADSINESEQLQRIATFENANVLKESDAEQAREVIKNWDDASVKDRAAVGWLIEWLMSEVKEVWGSG